MRGLRISYAEGYDMAWHRRGEPSLPYLANLHVFPGQCIIACMVLPGPAARAELQSISDQSLTLSQSLTLRQASGP
jgi:hypothetical protein